MSISEDQNFDSLSQRFKKNIYHTAKGKIRLSILNRDLVEQISDFEKGGLKILDAGAGQGHFSQQLAEQGHQLTLCDVSEKMLAMAKESFAEAGLLAETEFLHTSVQSFSEKQNTQYDLLLFHAVLEWLAEPEKTLQQLPSLISPGGYLSLMFYSRTGLIYQNLIHGNFDLIINNQLAGEGKTLTPTNPQEPADVYKWLENMGLVIKCVSGVRVFYDGIPRLRRKDIREDELIELEKKFSRIEPYCKLARYIHVVCQKPG